MEVLFIIPPSPFLLDEKVFINLGILKVAASLEKKGVNVKVLDLAGKTDYIEYCLNYIKENNPSVIGITTTTPQYPFVVSLVREVKKTFTKKIIIGGAHPTLVHTSYKKEKSSNTIGRGTKNWNSITELFDVVVCGDGEFAIFKALDSLNSNETVVIDADKTDSDLFMSSSDFDESMFPARHLIDLGSYNYKIDGENATSIIAQLGCPFACGFCSGRNSPMLRRIRQRSSDNIVEEIDIIYENYGYKGIMFYDDELNVNTSVNELMQKLIDYQNKKGISLRNAFCFI